MAVIRRMERNNIAAPGPATLERAPQSTGLQSLGQGLQDVGDMFQVWQDEIDTADAKAADAQFTEQLNDLLYNDQTGFMYQSGSNATSQRSDVAKRIEAAQRAALDQLSPAARSRAESAIAARAQGAIGNVNRHTAGERRTYLNDAAQARVEASLNAGIYEPGQIGLQLSVADQEIDDMADREGWSPEVAALKKQDARDKVYLGVMDRMMTLDPSQALDFFNENRDSMSGAAVSRIERELVPEIKRRRGRAAGQDAFSKGVTTEYLGQIRQVESGGNDLAKNPRSSATGRYQFTSGTWADLMQKHPDLGLTRDGRTDGAQQEVAIRALTADNAAALKAAGHSLTGANLYAAHFLGAGGAKSVLGAPAGASLASLVGAEVMQANPFLAGMTVADFKAWTVQKAGNGLAYSSERGSVTDLLDIADPIERQAAIQEYELRAAAEQGQIEAARSAASQSVLEMIEGGGSVNDIDTDTRQALGPEVMKAARTYEKQKLSGETLVTDSRTYVELSQMAGTDPAGFIATDPMLYRYKLDDSDFQYFVNMRRTMQTEGTAKAPSVESMLSAADARLRSAGITKTDNPDQYSLFRYQVTLWANANPADAADPVKMQQQINAMLTPVVLDPDGWGKKSGNLYEFDTDGSTFTEDDNLDMQYFEDALLTNGLTMNGNEVTPDVADRVAQLMTERLGRPATLSELLTALAMYYR